MGRHVGVFCQFGSAHLVQQRAQAAPPEDLQTVERSSVRGEVLKFWDVIGLYLDPPARALVLCCDEKSQCQALERTQLPLAPKRSRTMTHDYIRHGTVTLLSTAE